MTLTSFLKVVRSWSRPRTDTEIGRQEALPALRLAG